MRRLRHACCFVEVLRSLSLLVEKLARDCVALGLTTYGNSIRVGYALPGNPNNNYQWEWPDETETHVLEQYTSIPEKPLTKDPHPVLTLSTLSGPPLRAFGP